jgi:hypothetical protein
MRQWARLARCAKDERALMLCAAPYAGVLFVALTVAKRVRGNDNGHMRKVFSLAVIVPLLAGCSVAKTAVDVAMVPVHVAAAGVNAVVPSQKKTDQKRGREMRKEDEERGKQFRLAQDRCRKGEPLPTDPCATPTAVR